MCVCVSGGILLCDLQVVILGNMTIVMLMAQLGSDGPASHTDLYASMDAQKMKASKTKENIEGQTHCFMASITQELPAGMCAHLVSGVCRSCLS